MTSTISPTPDQLTDAQLVINGAQDDLGTLTIGQKTDLLMDNLEWIGCCDDARRVLYLLGYEKSSAQNRVEAALKTLKAWGWTRAMIDAACDAHALTSEQAEFFEDQVHAGEQANRDGIAAMRAAS